MGLLIGVGQTRPTYAYDYYYGVERDTTVSNPTLTRIGKDELHAELPIQSLMRRCILNDDGEVVYYLHANNSALRDNGAAANLDGTDGQVMVEIPEHYERFEVSGTKERAMISTVALPGFHKVEKMYVSAYEATIDRTNSKLASVVNTTAQYRGGNNSTTYDEDTMRTYLGRPASDTSLTSFRTLARARKANSTEWNCNTYLAQKTLYWLFAIEYATLNSQASFNAALDENGYHQGGLGAGVTTLNDSKWSAFNGYHPFIPCGTTNSLGNHTGVVDYTLTAGTYDTDAFTVSVPSYRGVENPFGHIWKWTDGCLCNLQADGDGGESQFYVWDEVADYASSINTAKMSLRGTLSRTSGYVKSVCLGEYGEIMPSAVGAGSTTYFCDYFYTSIPSSGSSTRGVLFGGKANNGANAGFVYANTNNAPSNTNADIGSRLCFHPAA